MKKQVAFKRSEENVLCWAFNTGQAQHVRGESAGVAQVDARWHTVTRNAVVVPVRLGRNVVGCMEVANKRGVQEFTD